MCTNVPDGCHVGNGASGEQVPFPGRDQRGVFLSAVHITVPCSWHGTVYAVGSEAEKDVSRRENSEYGERSSLETGKLAPLDIQRY